MKEKIKFGIVGYGRIGKRHAQHLYNNKQAELIAVCDVDTQKDDGQHKFFDSIENLLNAHPEIDVVSICTPNGLHASHALEILDSKKHVIIEKPMALSKADCEKVIYKSLNVSKSVFCVMQNRYSPPSKWLKEIITNDIIGEINLVQINCYWNRDDRYYAKNDWHGTQALDGGVLFTQFSHFIDIMYWLFGDIKNIVSRFQNFNHQESTEFDDSGFVNFDFINGGIGTINFSTAVWNKNFESSITILGSKGTVKVGGQYMDKVEYCEIENYDMPALEASNPPNDYGNYKGSASNHQYIFDNVIDVLHGKSTITTNALEGLKVVDIIERIYQA